MKLKRIPSVIIASLLLFLCAGCSSYLCDLNNCMNKESQESTERDSSPSTAISIQTNSVPLANLQAVVSSLTQNSTIVMTGQVNPSDLVTIREILNSSSYMINLDLSNVTGLDLVPEGSFSHVYNLSGLSLPDTVTSIEDDAFSSTCFMTYIDIPVGVISIGEMAFFECISLSLINIPASVTSIGRRAFSNCTNLSSVSFSDTSNWYKNNGNLTDVSDSEANAELFKLPNVSIYLYKQ